mmetsp:Transcript_23392/g.48917  ORF Transcript_23392/g.48917 Transcript_23392/m.48917 type:complete len:172 (-) Transcript_23392:29-544(-)
MEKVRMKYDLSKGDMPRTNEFKRCLEHFLDFSVFPPINNELIQCLDRLIQEDIPKIVGGADVVTDRFEILGKASIQRGNANDKSEKMSQSCNDIANKAKISTTIKYVTVLFIMVLFAVGVIKNDWTALQSSYSFSEFHDVSLQLLEQVMHAIKVALGGFMSTLTVLKDTLF